LSAVHKTKAARRSVQRRKIHAQTENPTPKNDRIADVDFDDITEIEIEPFDEMDDWS